MCHWRRVQNHYKRCGHEFDLPDEMIQCEDRFCKFSSAHPSDCKSPACADTCWQYRTFPAMYRPELDRWCPVCVQAGKGGGPKA
ncbi:hypothetical protein FIBSPDRAFT_845472 [Athelia psychrophila]|uniref:Uncharacterized protein n=1 Tax=Athelia psychrophila TaxID=1759441 RepID=A0A167TEK6_9AGAM|nr:hypothetical protein FIBSPDRAFT_845472 [Fibularhizoctonia sp. CBS 109695]